MTRRKFLRNFWLLASVCGIAGIALYVLISQNLLFLFGVLAVVVWEIVALTILELESRGVKSLPDILLGILVVGLTVVILISVAFVAEAQDFSMPLGMLAALGTIVMFWITNEVLRPKKLP